MNDEDWMKKRRIGPRGGCAWVVMVMVMCAWWGQALGV